MKQYKESRKRNISLLLRERKHSISSHETLQEKLRNTLETFHTNIEHAVMETLLLKEHLKQRNAKRAELEDRGLIKMIFKGIMPEQQLDSGLFALDVDKTSKAFTKYWMKRLAKDEEEIIASFQKRNRKTKALRNEVAMALRHGYSEETGLKLLSLIDSFLAGTAIKNLDGVGRLIETLNSDAHEEIYTLTRDYIEEISEHRPELSKDMIKIIAELNIKHLDKAVNGEKEEKRKYFDTLEGRVLAYATYALELKKAEGTEETEEDLEYQIFLGKKSEEALERIGNINEEKMVSEIMALEEKDRITEDDTVYLTAGLRVLYKKDDETEEKPDEEERRIIEMILKDDFKVHGRKGRELSRIVTEGSIGKVYSALSSGLGDKQARLLITTNPDLFYMDNGTIERYIQSVKELTDKARKYSDIEEFDPERKPESFASFEALHSTRAKIDGLERTVLQTVDPSELKIMISRKALERARKDPYVSENKDRYLREIGTIAKNPLGRKKREKIGEFNVSPMGRSRKGFRVAWHYDGATNTLFIDDLLYHTTQLGYVGNWNTRANVDIKRDYYERHGFEIFSGEI